MAEAKAHPYNGQAADGWRPESYTLPYEGTGSPLTREVMKSWHPRERAAPASPSFRTSTTRIALPPRSHMRTNCPPNYPVPVYAIDDESAVQVIDGTVQVISAGQWRHYSAGLPTVHPDTTNTPAMR